MSCGSDKPGTIDRADSAEDRTLAIINGPEAQSELILLADMFFLLQLWLQMATQHLPFANIPRKVAHEEFQENITKRRFSGCLAMSRDFNIFCDKQEFESNQQIRLISS